MLCQKCNKSEAVTKYRDIYLCVNCLIELGIKSIVSTSSGADSLELDNIISGILNSATVTNTGADIVRCEMCGASFRDFAESGKAGCAKCYSAFYSKLLPSLQKIHGNVSHTGKIPASAANHVKKQREIENLKSSLSKAIETQEFEQAAEIRDKLKQLAEG